MEAFLGGKGGSGKAPLVEDESSSAKSGKITFNQPAGFKIPDGVKAGDKFDAMATLEVDEDGKLCLHQVDGTDVQDEHEPYAEGSDEEEATETPEEEATEDESTEEPTSEKPVAEEPAPEDSEEEDDGEEPSGFLDAIEKKAKKLKK
jgi:hypothetical protein